MSKEFDARLGALVALLVKDRAVPRTSLNKLCFFADVASLKSVGDPISSGSYIKLQYGPVPKGIDYTRSCLINWSLLRESAELDGPYVSYRYRASQEVNFEAIVEDPDANLSDEKVGIIDRVRSVLARRTASYLSEKSHEFEPWLGADMGDDLSLERAVDDGRFIQWLQHERIIC